ncbi:hypothetical protein [Peribacillus frigoritolerans]|uniref:hypothetical protein n=1 Tax=Peribacillus frigoritolerans TaxID=450367 RepID=UPI000FDAD619|nr:hypothetical protein [Peribacillus frigoritolerans]AZV60080.1 hypothetical protein DOZ91_05240 [Peribacillus frigoritolerans]
MISSVKRKTFESAQTVHESFMDSFVRLHHKDSWSRALLRSANHLKYKGMWIFHDSAKVQY